MNFLNCHNQILKTTSEVIFFVLLGFSEAYSQGMIMELCLALSLVRWSKYLGIDAAKLNVKHWLNLVAQVAWWVENCMIGASTRIGQVSRFSLTTAMIKPLAYINQTATLQLNVKFAWFYFDNGFAALKLILICRLVSLYRIKFWSRPTQMKFFKLLTVK